MSFAGITYAMTVPALSSSERLIFIYIAEAEKNGTCFPSQAWFAKRTGLCIRTVRSALDGLEKKGHIEREIRYIDGKRTTDLIHARLPEKGKKQPAKSAARKLQKVPSNPSTPYGVREDREEAPNGAGYPRGVRVPALRSITGGRA